MRRLSEWRFLIQYIVIPLAGVVLAFFLAHQPGERPTLVVLAGAMMGYPLASLADRIRAKEKEEGE